jgi:hypothetical protein
MSRSGLSSLQNAGTPFGNAGFARMVERAGAEAKLVFKAHRICSGSPVATRWPTEDRTPGRLRPTFATATFNTPFGIQNYRRPASRTFGELERRIEGPMNDPAETKRIVKQTQFLRGAYISSYAQVSIFFSRTFV